MPAADKLSFMAAPPAYSGQMAAAVPADALPYPSDDAMRCDSSMNGGHEVTSLLCKPKPAVKIYMNQNLEA